MWDSSSYSSSFSTSSSASSVYTTNIASPIDDQQRVLLLFVSLTNTFITRVSAWFRSVIRCLFLVRLDNCTPIPRVAARGSRSGCRIRIICKAFHHNNNNHGNSSNNPWLFVCQEVPLKNNNSIRRMHSLEQPKNYREMGTTSYFAKRHVNKSWLRFCCLPLFHCCWYRRRAEESFEWVCKNRRWKLSFHPIHHHHHRCRWLTISHFNLS